MLGTILSTASFIFHCSTHMLTQKLRLMNDKLTLTLHGCETYTELGFKVSEKSAENILGK
jgi:hypothetical protein